MRMIDSPKDVPLHVSGEDSDDTDYTDRTNIFTGDITESGLYAGLKVPPCLVLLSGPSENVGTQWNLETEKVILGRSPGSGIFLPDTRMSKSHLTFSTSGEQVYCMDMGTTNGTLLNGEPMTANENYLLRNNDKLKAGTSTFKFLERGIIAETAEKARMQTELEKVRLVQESLLPPNREATYDWIRIAGVYQPATECSGDWWWHWSAGEKTFVIICDTTGHGAAAALMTSAARSAIATVEDDPQMEIDRVYSVLSNAIRKCSGGRLTMTAFIMEIDRVTRQIRYINASHLPAIVLEKYVVAKDWRSVEHFAGPHSSALGSDQPSCTVSEIAAVAQTRVVLLTDGITERRGVSGQALSDRQFYGILLEAHSNATESQREFLDTLLKLSNENARPGPVEDDMTAIVIDFD